MRLAPLFFGFLLVVAGTIGAFMLAGNPPGNLFFAPPMMAMVLIPTGCCTVAFGIRGPIVVIRSFAGLSSADPMSEKTPSATRIISACIGYVYAAGAFVAVASLVTIMASFPEVANSGLAGNLGGTIAATIASLSYPVILAEFILRPLKHRLELLEQ
jgi:hypothetical protein